MKQLSPSPPDDSTRPRAAKDNNEFRGGVLELIVPRRSFSEPGDFGGAIYPAKKVIGLRGEEGDAGTCARSRGG